MVCYGWEPAAQHITVGAHALASAWVYNTQVSGQSKPVGCKHTGYNIAFTRRNKLCACSSLRPRMHLPMHCTATYALACVKACCKPDTYACAAYHACHAVHQLSSTNVMHRMLRNTYVPYAAQQLHMLNSPGSLALKVLIAALHCTSNILSNQSSTPTWTAFCSTDTRAETQKLLEQVYMLLLFANVIVIVVLYAIATFTTCSLNCIGAVWRYQVGSKKPIACIC